MISEYSKSNTRAHVEIMVNMDTKIVNVLTKKYEGQKIVNLEANVGIVGNMVIKQVIIRRG